jgi:hypothetical protein
MKIVSYEEAIINYINSYHDSGHVESCRLFKRVRDRYLGSSEKLCEAFSSTCLTCIKQRRLAKVRGRVRAGHTPIITDGFGSSAQIDCIALQSSEFNGYKWALSYGDRGLKFGAVIWGCDAYEKQKAASLPPCACARACLLA